MARILLIENDNDVANIFAEWLRGAGHRVDHAVVPSGAIARAAVNGYDLILVDLVLASGGEVDGAIVALAIRGLGYVGPVILVTGGIVQVEPWLIERAGIREIVRKPILDMAKFVETINYYIAETQERDDNDIVGRTPQGSG